VAAEIITVCEAIKTWIADGLDAPGDATVSRVYIAPVNVDTLTTRQIFVFPLKYSNGPATRGEDEWVYGVQVTCVEKYTTAGNPTNTWLDNLVEFVQHKISDRCDFVRELFTFASTRELFTQTNEVTVYDEALLSQEKLFRSDVVFEFRETLTA
jgi:hypothetical protein